MLPLTSVLIHAFSMVDTDNLLFMVVPILLCVTGVSIFNYIIAREHRNLFLLEKYSSKTQKEQMEIINLLPGGVMIVDLNSSEILFKNDSVDEFGISFEKNKLVSES